MSACKLGAKKLRQAERAIGEPLLMAFAWPSGIIEAVTPDDRHFTWDRRSGEVAPEVEPEMRHWTTCPTSIQWRIDHGIAEEPKP